MSDIPWSEVSEERKEAARTEYARESGLGGFPDHMNDWDVRPHVDDPGGAFAPRENGESESSGDQQDSGSDAGGLDPSADTSSPVNREAIAVVMLVLALLGGGLGGN